MSKAELIVLSKKLKEENDELKSRLEARDAEIAKLKKMIFGSRSEKITYIDNNLLEQINLFGSMEPPVEKKSEPKESVQGYSRKQRENYDTFINSMVESGNFDVEDEIIDLPEEQRFAEDGTPLTCIGTELVRRTLISEKQKYIIKRVLRRVYGSPKEKEDLIRHTVKKPEAPSALIPHSPASSSVVADVAVKKFEYGLPLYRQERQLKDAGVPVRRNTLANWVIMTSHYIELVVSRLKEELLTQPLIHADETPTQVLHNSKNNPRAKLYIWAYASGKTADRQVAIFDYNNGSRAGKTAVKFLQGYHGCLISDGFSGYGKVKEPIRGGCWAHARRKWFHALPDHLKLKDSKNDRVDETEVASFDPTSSVALQCLFLINKLFEFEAQYEKEQLKPEQRLSRRKKDCSEILERYWSLVDEARSMGGEAKKAVTYSVNQKPFLMAFMEHGEMEISNNRAENIIRNYVIGRKNWLFNDTEAGAKASAAYYSLLVTARANGLDVYEYLSFVLDQVSAAVNGKKALTDAEMAERIEGILPWEEKVQEKFGVCDTQSSVNEK